MIEKEIIKRIGELARIEISPEESSNLQLFKIIEYVDKLKEVDIEGVEPMRGPQQQSLKTPPRQDKAIQDSTRKDILNNAPSLSDGFFKIPKVIE